MSKTSKIIWWIVGIVVVVGIVWWGVSRNGSSSGNTIKVGWIGTLTGSIAAYGEAGQNVTQIAVDEINASGGINGKKIEMIYEDGACDGTTAANAMQKLANIDRVQVAFSFCSAESLAAVPIATQAKVLLISQGSSNPGLTNASPYFFRDYPSDNSQGKVLADAAYNLKHWRTVAVLQEQSDYPAGIAGAFTQEFQSLGGKVVSQQYQTDTTDFRTPLLKLKSQNPEALFIDSLGTADAPRILQQMNGLNWELPLLVDDSVADDAKTVAANAPALEGALTAQFAPDPNNAKFKHLLSAYKTKYGTDLPFQNYGQTEYDAVYLLADGIKAVGYNGTALAQWSRTITNWQGASGPITIDSGGDRVGGDTLEVIHDGATQPVQK